MSGERQAMQLQLIRKRMREGGSYYVLWVSTRGIKAWSGPFSTLDEVESSTAVRDSYTPSFIVQCAPEDVRFSL